MLPSDIGSALSFGELRVGPGFGESRVIGGGSGSEPTLGAFAELETGE